MAAAPQPNAALAELELAVVGNVELVSFLALEQLLAASTINHATAFREEPAGATAVAAGKPAISPAVPCAFSQQLRKTSRAVPPWRVICRRARPRTAGERRTAAEHLMELVVESVRSQLRAGTLLQPLDPLQQQPQ